MREPIPRELCQVQQPVSSGDVPDDEQVPSASTTKHKKSRSRSISAPQWLRPAAELGRRLSKTSIRPGSSHEQVQPEGEQLQQQEQQGKHRQIVDDKV